MGSIASARKQLIVWIESPNRLHIKCYLHSGIYLCNYIHFISLILTNINIFVP